MTFKPKKILKWIGIALLTPILLFVLLVLLLYIPPIQNWAAKKVAAYASEKTGMDISVGKVRLKFPLDLSVEDFRMLKQNDSLPGVTDTIADVGQLVADVKLWPLLKSKVEIDGFDLYRTRLNTNGFIPEARVKGQLQHLHLESHDIDLDKQVVRVNTVALDDARLDVSLSDTVPPDTTESITKWQILVDDLKLNNTALTLHTPRDENTMHANVGTMHAKQGRVDLMNGDYRLQHLSLDKTSLSYDNNLTAKGKENRSEEKGERKLTRTSALQAESGERPFDADHIHLTDISLDLDSFSYKEKPERSLQQRQRDMLQVAQEFCASRKEAGKEGTESGRSKGKDKSADSWPAKVQRTSDDYTYWFNRMQQAMKKGEVHSKMDFRLNKCQLREQSGAQIDDLSGHVTMDDGLLRLPGMHLQTPHSRLDANVQVDFNNLGESLREGLYADVDGSIGKADIMRFAGDALPQGMRKNWPNEPLKINGLVRGNMQRMEFNQLHVNLPGTIDMHTTGHIENFSGGGPLRADLTLNGKTGNTAWLTDPYINPRTSGVNIPSGIGLDGHIKVNGDNYSGNVNIAQGGGKATVKGSLDSRAMRYDADIAAQHFPLQNFLPGQGLSPFTGTVRVRGTGTDLMSPHTSLVANADIKQFTYNGNKLDGTKLHANVHNGQIDANIDSRHPLMQGKLNFTASTRGGMMGGRINADMANIDLQQLGMTDRKLVTSGHVNADIRTNLKDIYEVDGRISNLRIDQRRGAYNAADIDVRLLSRPDTLYADVNTGDMRLHVEGDTGHEKILDRFGKFVSTLSSQIAERDIRQEELFSTLPNLRMDLDAGKDNILSHVLQDKNIAFSQTAIHMNTSPVNGINGNIAIDSLYTDAMLFDTIRLGLHTEDNVLTYKGQVRNNKDNPDYTFNLLFDGKQQEEGIALNATLFDEKERLAMQIGAATELKERGVQLVLTDLNPVLAYKQFHVDADNYISLDADNRLSARMILSADDNTAISIMTNDENTEALQDLTVSMQNIDLEKTTEALPFMPDLHGILNGDFHIIQTDKQLSVSTSMDIASMEYDGCGLGDIGADFVYIPKDDGSHFVDGILSQNGREVCTLNGSYNPAGEGGLDATLSMDRLPLSVVDGFLSDGFVSLQGYANGDISMKGPLSSMDINGDILTDSAYVMLPTYGISLRVEDRPLHVDHSTLKFEDFKLYGYNNEPLTMNGTLDFRRLDNMNLNMRMTARNLQIINAKESNNAEAYGKAFINFMSVISGPVNHLRMRGRTDVLGSTDMTYVLRDSPLTTDNRLEELVTFVDFSDTTVVQTKKAELSGLDMDMSLNIDEGARIKCDLNEDHTNYIDLIGGGTLRMQTTLADDFRLTGRYTLTNGEMKYSLPIIPLKTFNIKEGSYIEFTGDAENPTLNITATEHMRSAVGEGAIGSRIVDFECGVVVTQTLKNMGLEFIIDAPEDMNISNELNTLSKEERGKVAVTMLTTGMYLTADGENSNVNMNTALGAFLQSEINNLTGRALRTLDLQIGVDNTTDAYGSLHTDYSFKFAKRFWNNRLKISIGGRVSTGAEVYNQSNSFLDNVTFEYRLSPTSNKYVNLFYKRNSYDWIEGDVGKFGAGFLWRRKLQHFKDIFRFKTETPQPMRRMQPRDSTSTQTMPLYRRDTLQIPSTPTP